MDSLVKGHKEKAADNLDEKPAARGGRGVERWAGAQPDSDGSPPRRRARRVRVGAPARRSPNFSSGGGDAADAIDVDDEPLSDLPVRRRPVVARRGR